MIGKGRVGEVWKVKMKKNRQTCAMKEMGKSKITEKPSVHSVMNEKELFQQLDHVYYGRLNIYFNFLAVSS